MKAFTDLEQSKKLAEILPIESADMGYNVFVDNSVRCLPINDWDLNKDGSNGVKFIPCWSLAALLEIIRNIERTELQMCEGGYYFEANGFMTELDFNAVDVCVEMIIQFT